VSWRQPGGDERPEREPEQPDDGTWQVRIHGAAGGDDDVQTDKYLDSGGGGVPGIGLGDGDMGGESSAIKIIIGDGSDYPIVIA
jgi:hypothetical protein